MSWLRIDIYDATGARRAAGPVARVLSFHYGQRLDEVGDFELVLPAGDEHGLLIEHGDELRFFRVGEGELFRGLVDSSRVEIAADGTAQRHLSGASVARELVWSNTLLGRSYEGESLAAAVSDLLTETEWEAGALDDPVHTLTARFDGISTWSALEKVAQVFGLHLREDPRTRTVDLGHFGEVSDVVLRNVATVDPALQDELAFSPVSEVTLRGESRDVWNRVIPLGAGEGVNKLDLAYCDRAVAEGDPYDVLSEAGPDGRTYYYLEEASSVASYGQRIRPLIVKEASPLANSTAGFRAAANALYDVAATWLQRRSQALTSYQVTVPGFRHVDPETGTSRVRVGERIRLVYRGIVESETGERRSWVDVDEALWLMEFRRSFNAYGQDTWRCKLNTVDRTVEDVATAVARTFEDFYGLQVALKPYTYREVHGPQRESVQSGSRIEFSVRFDDNVALLHQARLSVAVKRVRSNAASAAAGGAQFPTTSGSGNLTSDLGGFGSGSSSWNGDHVHLNYNITLNASAVSPHHHWVLFNTESAGGHGHDFSFNPHSHVVASHAHSVWINDHTHSLVYGIFEGPQPVSPGVELHINGGNYTVPLAGPWNDDFEVDITEYLQDSDGQPLRQENVFWFYANELVDLEITVRSLVTATSLVPVG